MKKKRRLKAFHITTLDGTAQLHFFTRAKNHKKALATLISKSYDYKSVEGNSDMTITIKRILPKRVNPTTILTRNNKTA